MLQQIASSKAMRFSTAVSQSQETPSLTNQTQRSQLTDFITDLKQEIDMLDKPEEDNEFREIQGPISEKSMLFAKQLMFEIENSGKTEPQKMTPLEERLSRINNEINELEERFASTKNLLNCATQRRPGPIPTFKGHMRLNISRGSERSISGLRMQQSADRLEDSRISGFEGPRVRFYQLHSLNKINRRSRKIRRN